MPSHRRLQRQFPQAQGQLRTLSTWQPRLPCPSVDMNEVREFMAKEVRDPGQRVHLSSGSVLFLWERRGFVKAAVFMAGAGVFLPKGKGFLNKTAAPLSPDGDKEENGRRSSEVALCFIWIMVRNYYWEIPSGKTNCSAQES